jgi:hypothetical protein
MRRTKSDLIREAVGRLLDTDVLTDYLRSLPAAGRYVDGLAEVPTCSEVTRVEVLRGMRPRERRVTERFLATIHWRPSTCGTSPCSRGWNPPTGASGAGRRFRASLPGGRRRGG